MLCYAWSYSYKRSNRNSSSLHQHAIRFFKPGFRVLFLYFCFYDTSNKVYMLVSLCLYVCMYVKCVQIMRTDNVTENS